MHEIAEEPGNEESSKENAMDESSKENAMEESVKKEVQEEPVEKDAQKEEPVEKEVQKEVLVEPRRKTVAEVSKKPLTPRFNQNQADDEVMKNGNAWDIDRAVRGYVGTDHRDRWDDIGAL